MSSDIGIMKNDLRVVISNLAPDLSLDIIESRLEEVLYKYEVKKRSTVELENDLQEKLDFFISSKRLEGLAETTLKDYRDEIGLFMRTNTKAAVEIQTPDIRRYLGALDDVESSTIGKKLSVLKSFFGWMVQEEILLRDVTAKIKLPKKKKRIPKGLTVSEFELVRESCVTKRERALIEVFYSTGCRLSELAGMDIDRINRQDMSTIVIGKGNAERKVYFNFMSMYHLDAYLETRSDGCNALFITQRRPFRRMSNHSIQDEIHNIEQRSNINKPLHPHIFRHSLAQNMLNNGAKLEEIQHILGHSSIGTTETYAHVSEEQKQAAHKRFA